MSDALNPRRADVRWPWRSWSLRWRSPPEVCLLVGLRWLVQEHRWGPPWAGSGQSTHPDTVRRLWTVSEELTGVTFPERLHATALKHEPQLPGADAPIDPWGRKRTARSGQTPSLGRGAVHQNAGESDGDDAGQHDGEQADAQAGEVGDESDEGRGQQGSATQQPADDGQTGTGGQSG